MDMDSPTTQCLSEEMLTGGCPESGVISISRIAMKIVGRLVQFLRNKPAKEPEIFTVLYADRNVLDWDIGPSDYLKKLEESNRASERLFEAVKEGKVSEVKKILEDWPEAIVEFLTPSSQTTLHVAAMHGQVEVFSLLVEQLRENKSCFSHVINMKDSCGDTALHLAVARKQLQTVKLLLEDSTYSGKVKVNAKNDGGFTAFDILDVLPEDGKEDMEIEKILRRAGALRARELTGNKVGSNLLIEQKLDSSKHEVLIEFYDRWNGNFRSERSESLMSRYFAALIAATLIAAMTFHAALRPPAVLRQEFPSINATMIVVQDGVINPLFVLFNSIAFFTTLAFITILTHELPIKPWLHISVFSAIGAYMCSITLISPQEVVTVLIIGSSIMLTALLRCLALHKRVLNNLQWMCARIHLI